MWIKTTSILLVVVLINLASAQKWQKNSGIATPACPLDDDPDDPTVLPFQGDCTKFIKCSYGLAYTLSCPRGLHWSSTLDRCESPIVAMCDSTITTTKPAIGGGGCTFSYKPDPSDCKKAIECLNGIEYPIECPLDLVWDKIKNKCAYNNGIC